MTDLDEKMMIEATIGVMAVALAAIAVEVVATGGDGALARRLAFLILASCRQMYQGLTYGREVAVLRGMPVITVMLLSKSSYALSPHLGEIAC